MKVELAGFEPATICYRILPVDSICILTLVTCDITFRIKNRLQILAWTLSLSFREWTSYRKSIFSSIWHSQLSLLE